MTDPEKSVEVQRPASASHSSTGHASFGFSIVSHSRCGYEQPLTRRVCACDAQCCGEKRHVHCGPSNLSPLRCVVCSFETACFLRVCAGALFFVLSTSFPKEVFVCSIFFHIFAFSLIFVDGEKDFNPWMHNEKKGALLFKLSITISPWKREILQLIRTNAATRRTLTKPACLLRNTFNFSRGGGSTLYCFLSSPVCHRPGCRVAQLLTLMNSDRHLGHGSGTSLPSFSHTQFCSGLGAFHGFLTRHASPLLPRQSLLFKLQHLMQLLNLTVRFSHDPTARHSWEHRWITLMACFEARRGRSHPDHIFVACIVRFGERNLFQLTVFSVSPCRM